MSRVQLLRVFRMALGAAIVTLAVLPGAAVAGRGLAADPTARPAAEPAPPAANPAEPAKPPETPKESKEKKSWFKTWIGLGTTSGEAECRTAYREIVAGAACTRIFEFSERCRNHVMHPVAATVLRLRCADELVDRRYKSLVDDYTEAEKVKTCSAMSEVVEMYGQDFDLAEAPELEKANSMRLKLCEEEEKVRERVRLTQELADAIRANDCATFKAFEKQAGTKLNADQAKRLSEVMGSRCEEEQKQTAALQTCLDDGDRQGSFCAGEACFSEAKRTLTAEKFKTLYADESTRRTNICAQHGMMQSCLSGDPCDTNCSRQLRLTVASGPLIGHIQSREKTAKEACDSKLEAARLEEERKEKEQEAEARASSTFRLTICNRSTKGAIFVAMGYFDYDASDWVVEGWWQIEQDECTPMGDRFRKGDIYFYANTKKERWVWAGDFGLCVQWNAFRRINKSGITCPGSRFRKFIAKSINDSEYEQTFVD